MQILNEGQQVDAILLDFSKAFDKVPHQRLLFKLQHYGVRGQLLEWISDFLIGRTQSVVLEGQHSSCAHIRRSPGHSPWPFDVPRLHQ